MKQNWLINSLLGNKYVFLLHAAWPTLQPLPAGYSVSITLLLPIN